MIRRPVVRRDPRGSTIEWPDCQVGEPPRFYLQVFLDRFRAEGRWWHEGDGYLALGPWHVRLAFWGWTPMIQVSWR